MHASFLALLALANLPCIFTKVTPLPTYPCLRIAESSQQSATKLNLDFSEIADYHNVFFAINCKVGATSFSYQCGEEACCASTKYYDGLNDMAKLPKGWYVYGCTEHSMCLGRDQGIKAAIYAPGVCWEDGDAVCDCDGEILGA